MRPTWLITGAASGIGRELAAQLARRGERLVLWDRDAERLAREPGAGCLLARGTGVDRERAQLLELWIARRDRVGHPGRIGSHERAAAAREGTGNLAQVFAQ